MRRLLTIVGALLALAAPGAAAATTQFSMPEIEVELMCPTCGTRLDLSHAPAAEQIRAYVERKRAAGWTKAQVKDALVAQFGEQILATTPGEGSGLIAWLVPIAVGLLGIGIAAGAAVNWRRRRRDDPVVVGVLDPDAERRVDEALARWPSS